MTSQIFGIKLNSVISFSRKAVEAHGGSMMQEETAELTAVVSQPTFLTHIQGEVLMKHFILFN